MESRVKLLSASVVGRILCVLLDHTHVNIETLPFNLLRNKM